MLAILWRYALIMPGGYVVHVVFWHDASSGEMSRSSEEELVWVWEDVEPGTEIYNSFGNLANPFIQKHGQFSTWIPKLAPEILVWVSVTALTQFIKLFVQYCNEMEVFLDGTNSLRRFRSAWAGLTSAFEVPIWHALHISWACLKSSPLTLHSIALICSST